MNLKQNLLLADLKDAHQLVSATVRMVFDHEKLFKEGVLGGKRSVGWESEDYSIERCHAANIYRLTLKHDDGCEKDIYVNSSEILDWVQDFL
ncbi:hypothetical protein VPBG_00095 [Vibrio phage helene 12B3]|uniref:hypothetical protein n=1 Tax=Vibrio phage helene 12B3 TaxID=573173 RepID=UPI0002C05EF6|nr:hypothetical protein VPBG_00095 [Vibrio phage helene 12B3]AGG57867.1 hypothetical protein VPBG_00095 [Vibrio phage helene 12B3]